MTNSWQIAEQMADQHAQGSGLFVKLPNDGDRVVGVFVGEPYPREVVWTGERYAEVDSADGKAARASAAP